MSRIAKQPIAVPTGVDVKIAGSKVSIKGPNGQLEREISAFVTVKLEDGNVLVASNDQVKCRKEQTALYKAIPGTTRALLNNMVVGVSAGYEKKLQLIGVGYRAQVKGKELGLTLGFSHPVNFKIPEGVTIETPEPTSIIVKGADKQLVGQVAADIRAYRPPEPYKGKGVRYVDEYVRRKESKKK
jgi:large subunit ribosomal protein L6